MSTNPLPLAALPVDRSQAPKDEIPSLACDTHVHMVAEPEDFPLWEGRVEDPAPGSFDTWLTRLNDHLTRLQMARVVIVHSILYGADNAVSLESVRRIGRDRARGIALVRDGASEAELDGLADAGVAGVRLNYVHGGILSWEGAVELAPRLAARGMHLQMLMFAHAHAADLLEGVRALPVPVVFDHIGWPNLSDGVGEPGFQILCKMLADGDAYVKLSGIYRVCGAPYDAAADHVAALVTANPERCLWGSDWPHLMLADAVQPDAGVLLNAFLDSVTDAETRAQILRVNPEILYRF